MQSRDKNKTQSIVTHGEMSILVEDAINNFVRRVITEWNSAHLTFIQ